MKSSVGRLTAPIPDHAIRACADRYPADYDAKVEVFVPRICRRGHLTRGEFLTLCRWKTPRSASRCRQNTEAEIREITGLALHTTSERLRIESLLLLHGVAWPTASVLLHFCHRDPYPILDFRALWSVGMDVPTDYSFTFWWEYVELCRNLATRNKVHMRTLDRALWQFSAENQP